MSCEHCKKRVENALHTVAGVKHVEVNLEKGMVTVTGDATEQIIISTIDDAGYDVVK